jgi:dienelactone hydrolase
MSIDRIRHYPALSASDVRLVRQAADGNAEQTLYVVESPFGYRRMAALSKRVDVHAAAPAVLFVHWYEPQAANSNRSQFEQEAAQLSAAGATCLLVETLWSDPDFFLKRTQADDQRASVEEAVNLRRSLDFLLSQPEVDPGRVGAVGHDFGGMYLTLAGGLDQRPTHYVIMAATPRFSDWYLYLPKLEAAARHAFVAEMADLDPISHIASLSPAPVLFQFAMDDPHVPRERAIELIDAAAQPKAAKWYQAGHGLNDEATRDRVLWLREQLRLA